MGRHCSCPVCTALKEPHTSLCVRCWRDPTHTSLCIALGDYAKAHLCAALALGPHSHRSIVWPWRDPACLAVCGSVWGRIYLILLCPFFPVPLHLPPHGCWLIVALPLVLLGHLPTVRLHPVEPGCADLLRRVRPILYCLELTMLPILLGTEMTLGLSSREEPAVARKLLLVRILFRMLGQPSY